MTTVRTKNICSMPVSVCESTSIVPPPIVSVIMTVHNRAQYLLHAVGSILSQSFRSWELIIVDDASTDGSGSAACCVGDCRVRVATLPERVGHRGVGRVLNVGLELARGTFVAICDSDDIRYVDSLHAQVEYLSANPAIGVVATRYVDLMPDGSPISTPSASIFEAAHGIRMHPGSWRDLTAWRNSFAARSSGELMQQILNGTGIYANCLCHSSVMYRCSVLDAHGRYDESRAYEVDIDLYRRVAKAGVGFAMLPGVFAGWRLHSRRMSVQKWIEAGDVIAATSIGTEVRD